MESENKLSLNLWRRRW